MFRVRAYTILAALVASTLACGLLTRPTAPTTIPPTTQPATPAIGATGTQAAIAATPSNTPISMQAAFATGTPRASVPGMPAPFGNLSNISQYFNPVGQPVQSWKGIPIMPQATAGQEFQSGSVYGFKATATIADATSFYQSKLAALGYSSFMPGPSTGSAGTGSDAIHNSFLYYLNGPQMVLVYIASYDSDPSHVMVVLST